jgi:multidrug efflux pump subunit AcrA (membrane-fusion protein)
MTPKILLSLVLLTAMLACGKKEEKKEAAVAIEEVIPVRIAEVGAAAATDPIQASGLLASETEARLAFKTGGVIQKIYVKEGDRVAKGQLLALLNLTEINAQVQQATESVQKSERDLKRVSNLYRDSVATLEQVQNLTTALNKKLMNDGELVGPGAPVLVVNATSRQDWVLRVGVSDKDWARLRDGNRADVHLDAFPNQSFSASVKNLSPVPDLNSGLYQAELSVQGLDPSRLATGLFGKATLYPTVLQTKGLTAIPIDALIEGNGELAYVFVPAGNVAKRIPIRISHFNNEKAFVASGLEGVESIIVDGSAYLTEGAKIKVVKSEK